MFERRFLLTDRGLDEIDDLLVAETTLYKDIAQLPPNSKLLVMGSGIQGKMERDISKSRPDIRIFSVDPSLHFNSKTKDIVTFFEHDSCKMILYAPKRMFEGITDYEIMSQENANRYHLNRLKNHGSQNPLPALAEELPFGQDSFDAVVDVVGPMTYVAEKEKYLIGLVRIIKNGGLVIAYVPVDEDFLALLNSNSNIELISNSSTSYKSYNKIVFKVSKD